MDAHEASNRDHMYQDVLCKYQPPHARVGNVDAGLNDCICPPDMAQAKCHCAGLSQKWTRESLDKRAKHPKPRGLIAYLRYNGAGLDLQQQRKLIDDYCRDNEYFVKETFIDQGLPSEGLQEAMKAVDAASGLIASDLNRFVEHQTDRMRDLRPFVHHFFCCPSKHLISVEEGIDTGSTAGQTNVVELMNQVKEFS